MPSQQRQTTAATAATAEANGFERESGYPSARSLLLTVLGEFVRPRRGQVWTGTLVQALGALGVMGLIELCKRRTGRPARV